MGSGLCPGFSDTLLQPAKPGTPAKSSYILRRAKLSYSSRGQHATRERGNHLGEKPFRPQEFLLNSVPCSQEKTSDEASNQPQEAERMGGTPTFQNGRYGDTQGTTERERVDGEGGPHKNAYFTIPIHTDHQPYLRFIVGQEHYQFTCVPFGLSCAPWVFTKVMKPIAIFLRARGVRMIVYVDDILLMADTAAQAKSHLETLTFLLTGLGFVINAQKSITTPTQQIEFLGFKVNSVSLHLSLPGEKLHHIRMEVRQHLQRLQVTARQLAQLIGKLHAALQAVLPAPLFYQSLQGDLHRVLNLTNQNYNALVSLSAQALEGLTWWQEKLTQMEWQGSAVQATDNYHHIRCISPGLGNSLQWYQNRGPMEPIRAGNAHKLPRVTGSNSSSKDLSEGSDRAVSTVTAGQSNSGSLHQQHGRYSVPPTDRSSQSPLDVGLVQRHSSDCRVHSRSSECCSRCRVQVHDGQGRSEASSQVVPRDQPEVGTPRGGPFCISPVHATTSLLQLETRPISRGDGCIHPAMGEVQRLCEPPMMPDRESLVTGAATTSSSNLSGSGMEGPALVSNPAGNAVRLSTTASSHTEPVSADIQCESNGSPAPTGRLACLWEKFGCRGLSEAAKELLLASWRSKTSRAYDSHFRKWLGWCTERG